MGVFLLVHSYPPNGGTVHCPSDPYSGGAMSIPKAGAEPLDDLAAFLEPFCELVVRSESRDAMERYTTGLLSDLQHKNASEMGRSLPGTSGQKLQEFLTRTRWQARRAEE